MEKGRRGLLSALASGGVVTLAGCATAADSGDGGDTASTTGDGTGSPATEQRSLAQRTKLTAADAGGADRRFGYSVATTGDGTTVVVGAYGYNYDDMRNAGTVYLFERGDNGWAQQARLTASDDGPTKRFGKAVAVSDDGTMTVVGAPEDNNSPYNRQDGSGTAYVFERTGGGWQQRATLRSEDIESGDHLGVSVDIAGDGSAAIIGAPENDLENGEVGTNGAAYVFRPGNEGWRQQVKLGTARQDPGANFGNSVSLSRDGTTAIVGDKNADLPDPSRPGGAAYVFELTDGNWQQQARLMGNDRDGDGFNESDNFGASIAVAANGTTAIVGSPTADLAGAGYTGAAYVFDRAGGDWPQRARLTPQNPQEDGYFGRVVAASRDGTTVLVGEPRRDSGARSTGAAYVFERSGDGWHRRTTLTASDGEVEDHFGRGAALAGDGTSAAVGAPRDENQGPTTRNTGSVYVFD